MAFGQFVCLLSVAVCGCCSSPIVILIGLCWTLCPVWPCPSCTEDSKTAHCSPDVATPVLRGGEGLEACVQGGQKADRKNFHSVIALSGVNLLSFYL